MNMGSMTTPRLLWQPENEKYLSAGRRWQGIPGIERTRNGRLYAAWYSGMTGEMTGNFVIVEKSDDDGRTWTDGFLIIEHEDANVRCFDPALWMDPQGRLWVFWAQSEHGQFDGRHGVWAAVCANPDDDSPEFSSPRFLANGVMLNKPTVLSNGDWLLPCSLWYNSTVSGPGHPELEKEWGANFYLSKDQGRTFSYLSGFTMPDQIFDEHSVIELKDGRLWALIRLKHGIGQAFSRDMGKTWENIGHSGHPGPNSRFNITRLKNGDLLFINHMNPTCLVSPSDWGRRDNLMAMLSKDDGKTWIGGLMLDTREGISYPDAVEAPDGKIYIIYDYSRYQEREILMAVIRPEDILEGGIISGDTYLRRVINKATGKLPNEA